MKRSRKGLNHEPWNLGGDARLPQFEGLSSISLLYLYHGMLMNITNKPGKKSKEEATEE